MIEAESGIEVPDPALVFQAYGEPRRMLPEQIPARLRQSRVQWLVTGTAVHDANGKMEIQLVKLPVKAPRPPTIPTFERNNIDISDEVTPEAAFAPLAAEALQALGFQAAATAGIAEEAPAQLSLPESVIEAEKQQQSAVEGLWLQELMGVLHHSLEYM